MWGFGDSSDSLDGLVSVVDRVLVHDRLLFGGDAGGENSSDTLLGFETTSPCPVVRVASPLGGVGMLLPHFGGGVWCLICG